METTHAYAILAQYKYSISAGQFPALFYLKYLSGRGTVHSVLQEIINRFSPLWEVFRHFDFIFPHHKILCAALLHDGLSNKFFLAFFHRHTSKNEKCPTGKSCRVRVIVLILRQNQAHLSGL